MPIKLLSSLEKPESAPIQGEAGKALAHQLGFEKWLPYAAESWEISKDLKDYFLVPVPIIYTGIPNRNGVSFPLSSLIQWNQNLHCCAYQGWKGCPVFLEHDWGDEKTGRKPKAYGIIADVALRPMKRVSKVWKVVTLLAIDRTKDRQLADKIESGERNSYSMGCTVEGYTCGYCGKEMGQCSHLDVDSPMDFREMAGTLVFRECYGVNAVEVSSVGDPAFGSALGDVRMRFQHGA